MKDIFNALWNDYISITPDAQKVHDLLEDYGETVINDHIALRTFNKHPISVSDIGKIIIDKGYRPREKFHFDEKHLDAQFFSHPDHPIIFISELVIEHFSQELQEICLDLVEEADKAIKQTGFTWPFNPWRVSHSTYQKLKTESEYAAWLSAFGIRANHFTLFINKLNKIKGIEELNAFLKENGFVLNASGGEIKGSEELYLKQSSTMAGTIDWNFSDGTYQIPGCYYEFAERFPIDDKGTLFDGFIAQSADKIFESTNLKE